MALLASHAQCRDLVISGRPDPCVLLELDEGLLGEVLQDGCVFDFERMLKSFFDGSATRRRNGERQMRTCPFDFQHQAAFVLRIPPARERRSESSTPEANQWRQKRKERGCESGFALFCSQHRNSPFSLSLNLDLVRPKKTFLSFSASPSRARSTATPCSALATRPSTSRRSRRQTLCFWSQRGR